MEASALCDWLLKEGVNADCVYEGVPDRREKKRGKRQKTSKIRLML